MECEGGCHNCHFWKIQDKSSKENKNKIAELKIQVKTEAIWTTALLKSTRILNKSTRLLRKLAVT